MRLIRLLLWLGILSVARTAVAEPCESDNFETRVSGRSQCLVMRRFGNLQPNAMVIWLHGDVSSGGPANYHFRVAEKLAQDFSAEKVLSVALVRPGYPDGEGRSSSVDPHHDGRRDHYTKVNVDEVGAAIERLRNHFNPTRTIVVGHSGGAASAAILLGMKPKLIDAAVLVSCPCDLVNWRVGRQAWNASENPIQWTETVALDARVIALTGERDDNTSPQLAQDYVKALAARGVNAEFHLLQNENHDSAFRASDITRAVRQLVAP